MVSIHRIILLSAAVLLAGCAAQRVIQPAADGLPASQIAIIATTAKKPQNGVTVSLERVTDAQGKDVVSLDLMSQDIRDTAVVVPGRYEIQVTCVLGSQAVEPRGKFDLRGGYTYVFNCEREGFRAHLVAAEIATATPH